MKSFRCSSLYKLMTKPRTKGKVLSETAKSHIRDVIRKDIYDFDAFLGNKYTQKGLKLESTAIHDSGMVRGRYYIKHEGRIDNGLINGECDVLDKENRLIIDTKCTWDIGSHPFFPDEALEKAEKAGYDWQMQGYMWLYDCDQAEIDFWLYPCPAELLGHWDDIDQLVTKVEAIPLKERLTTVIIKRDEEKIKQIQEMIPHCQAYYDELKAEIDAKRQAEIEQMQDDEELVIP